MRVLFVVPSLRPTGPTVFTWNLIQAIKGLTTGPSLDISVHSIDRKDGHIPSWFGGEVTFGIFPPRADFDILHSTMFRSDLVSAFWPRSSIRVIGMHNFVKEDLRLLYNPLRAWIQEKIWFWAIDYRQSTLVVSSLFMREYYRKFCRRALLSLIPYGVADVLLSEPNESDVSLLRSLRNSGYSVIGSVGGLIPRKGFSRLIEAAAQLPMVAVVIVGEGSMRSSLEALIRKLNMSDRVFLLGFRENSRRFYKYFDVFAMTSVSEGYNMAMLEAFAQGLPTVCARLPLYLDLIAENDVVFFDNNDLGALSASIERCLRERIVLGRRSRELFESKFNLKAMAERHVTLYESLK